MMNEEPVSAISSDPESFKPQRAAQGIYLHSSEPKFASGALIQTISVL